MDIFFEELLVWIVFLLLNVIEVSCVRQENICGTYNGRRLYLELGEKGVLFSGNTTLPKKTNQPNINIHEHCSIEIVTCPACVINVSFLRLNLSPQCGNSAGGIGEHQCRCDYLWLSEPPYDDVSGSSYCGLYQPSSAQALGYRSLTRSLSIMLLYTESHSNAFALEFTAERNHVHFSGSPRLSNIPQSINPGGEIMSPFFPAHYPRDLSSEYTIHCEAQLGVRCRIRLLFLDYQLATVSTMKFYNLDNEKQYIDSSSGASFRPPVILSSGPSLLIRFNANGGTGLGFKILYSFVTGTFDLTAIKPITYCGGYVENLGGAITMMNMIESGKTIKTYDCIWVIKPQTNYFHLKTHIYLKIVTFSNMADVAELVVRKGVTSDGPVIESLRYNSYNLKNIPSKQEHIVPLSEGFYVTLHGAFSASSRVAIIYSAFSFANQFHSSFPAPRDCFSGSELLCQNHRCISGHLSCDGFDHCGDNSDEPQGCYQEWGSDLLDRRWYAKIPNYYFPKMEPYPDLKTATLVFIVGTFGLMMLIVTLIVLLYRMGSRGSHQRELQNHLQTISDLLAAESRSEDTTTDEPPVYEAPPDYDEIIKLPPTPLLTPTPSHRPHRKRRNQQSPHSKASAIAIERSVLSSRLEVVLPPIEDSHLLRRHSLPDPILSSSTDALLGSLASNTTTPVHISNTPIPDSPPPPYAESTDHLGKEETWLSISKGKVCSTDIAFLVVPSSSGVRTQNSFPTLNIQGISPFHQSELSSNHVSWVDTENPSDNVSNTWVEIETPSNSISNRWTNGENSPSFFSDPWVESSSSSMNISNLWTEHKSCDFDVSSWIENSFPSAEGFSSEEKRVKILDFITTSANSSSNIHSDGTLESLLNVSGSYKSKPINYDDKLEKFNQFVVKMIRSSLECGSENTKRPRKNSLDLNFFVKNEVCLFCQKVYSSSVISNQLLSNSRSTPPDMYFSKIEKSLIERKLKENDFSRKFCFDCQSKPRKRVLSSNFGTSLNDLRSLSLFEEF